MEKKYTSVEEYIAQLPPDRKEIMSRLRAVVRENIPEGFGEELSYGMIGYCVPHTLYPKGYHVTPALPLPFVHLASQKSHIAVYHMGLYGDTGLLQWFLDEYQKIKGKKPDMGKSCIRFKKPEDIPLELIGNLMTKISVEKWIELYEMNLKR